MEFLKKLFDELITGNSGQFFKELAGEILE